jgi:hypothetical protein
MHTREDSLDNGNARKGLGFEANEIARKAFTDPNTLFNGSFFPQNGRGD